MSGLFDVSKEIILGIDAETVGATPSDGLSSPLPLWERVAAVRSIADG
jgi:hypothetical protein